MNESGKKYLRDIVLIGDPVRNEYNGGPHYHHGKVDVYAVLKAFNVTCPARAHAIKKLLCSGLRGKGDTLQDLSEAQDAIARAFELEEGKPVPVVDLSEWITDKRSDEFKKAVDNEK